MKKCSHFFHGYPVGVAKRRRVKNACLSRLMRFILRMNVLTPASFSLRELLQSRKRAEGVLSVFSAILQLSRWADTYDQAG